MVFVLCAALSGTPGEGLAKAGPKRPTEGTLEAAPAIDVATARASIELTEDRRWIAPGFDEVLHHGDPLVRAAAVRALGRVGDPEWFPAMLSALSDGDPGVRAMAAFAIGRLSTFRVTSRELTSLELRAEEALISAMGDRSTAGKAKSASVEDRVQALRALGEVGHESAVDALWATVATKGPAQVRRAALLGLVTLTRRQQLPPLGVVQVDLVAPCLFDEQGGTGLAAAMLLARASIAPDAAEALRTMIERAERVGSDVDRAHWLVRAYAKAGGEPTAIGSRIVDGAAPLEVRLGALRAAAASRWERQLLAGLAQSDPFLQEEAALALAASPTDAALQGLLAWVPTSDDLRAVRLVALGACGALPTADVLLGPIITSALADPSGPLRAAAAEAAATVPGLGQAVLDRWSIETVPAVRDALVMAMGKQSDPRGESTLIDALRDADTGVAVLAAEVLAERQGAHVRQALLDALDSTPVDERRIAFAEALARRSDLDESTALRLTQHDDRRIREIGLRAVVATMGRSTMGPTEPWADGERPSLPPRVSKDVRVDVITSRGTITLTLHGATAPIAVGNFVQLARANHFDGLVFHRVVPEFVVQTGDPRGDGTGGPGYRIPCETNPEPYGRGAVGMALSGKDTGGSQWFITLAPHPHLEGHYTRFGEVSSGWDVLDAIRRGDRILDVMVAQ